MDLHDAVALSTLSGLTRSRAFAIYKARLDDTEDVTLEEVITCAGRGDAADTLAQDARARAATLLAATGDRIAVIRAQSKNYPPMLWQIVDPPPVLWVRGVVEVLQRPGVAIIGSRAASNYALEVAERLAGELGSRGMTVVSGLARGADGAAHRGCVDAGGTTVAVLGSGVDRIYPPEHEELAQQICQHGAVISELGPGTAPLPDHFPARNRLISGISLAVVVVEANEKSGSLITARCALDQGREVMAVPGSVFGGRNRGSHALLKDGAKVVETADDILEELEPALRRIGAAVPSPPAGAGPKIFAKVLEKDELLDKLTPGQPYDLDEMSATVGLTGSSLLSRLTEWELHGRLRKVAGGRYMLAGQY